MVGGTEEKAPASEGGRYKGQEEQRRRRKAGPYMKKRSAALRAEGAKARGAT